MAKTKEPAQVYQLKITLRGIKPPIWRRVQVKDCSLADLHDIIRNCMGWGGFHLHAFEIRGTQYSEPDPDGMMEAEDASKVKLSQLVAQGVKKFTYVYDFGDNWEHILLIEKTLPVDSAVRYPRCVVGKRACPPDDCGGVWGYHRLLEAIQDPEHEEHEEKLEWVGGEFDPEEFDIERINARLQ